MCCIVDNFNVYLYSMVNTADNGVKYHLLCISKWNDDGNKQLKSNSLYVNHKCYNIAKAEVEKTSVLNKLIDLPRNSRICFASSINLVVE